MSLSRVARLVDRFERPTVNATILPALRTVLGYVTPSRIVSSAVALVRMIVHCAGGRLAGHDGAITGERVAPSSISCAAADAANSDAPAAAVAAPASNVRF